MTRLEDLDDDLRRLAVHDVTPERADRIRAACAKALAARAIRRHKAPLRAVWNWMEPVAALTICALYLATAVKAATVLMLLR